MKLSVVIPCSNQLVDTKTCWGSIVGSIKHKDTVEILAICDGDIEGTAEWLNKFVMPHFADHRVIEHDRIGVLAVMDEAWRQAKGDVIAILHNDVSVLEYGWDERVLAEFENDPKLGLAGFLGASGIGPTGGRQGTVSNLVEAEIHGERQSGPQEVITFDGLSLIGRREMFEQVGGFDQGYTFHHWYDRDLSLSSFKAGWTNKMIGVYCHHISGITANRPAYQEWIDSQMGTKDYTGDFASYGQGEARFRQKWGSFIGSMRYYHQRG